MCNSRFAAKGNPLPIQRQSPQHSAAGFSFIPIGKQRKSFPPHGVPSVSSASSTFWCRGKTTSWLLSKGSPGRMLVLETRPGSRESSTTSSTWYRIPCWESALVAKLELASHNVRHIHHLRTFAAHRQDNHSTVDHLCPLGVDCSTTTPAGYEESYRLVVRSSNRDWYSALVMTASMYCPTNLGTVVSTWEGGYLRLGGVAAKVKQFLGTSPSHGDEGHHQNRYKATISPNMVFSPPGSRLRRFWLRNLFDPFAVKHCGVGVLRLQQGSGQLLHRLHPEIRAEHHSGADGVGYALRHPGVEVAGWGQIVFTIREGASGGMVPVSILYSTAARAYTSVKVPGQPFSSYCSGAE